jgi:hypothetical protein
MLRSSDSFRLSLDAEPGEITSLQFFPSEYPLARPNLQSECMGSPTTAFEYSNNMGRLHNIEYSNLAMQLAEDTGIFESEILSAALISGGWMMGRDSAFELVAFVAVESVDGESATFTFQGRNRKELVGVEFFARAIDHAVNRDGSITEPTSRFVGNPDAFLSWVYR